MVCARISSSLSVLLIRRCFRIWIENTKLNKVQKKQRAICSALLPDGAIFKLRGPSCTGVFVQSLFLRYSGLASTSLFSVLCPVPRSWWVQPRPIPPMAIPPVNSRDLSNTPLVSDATEVGRQLELTLHRTTLTSKPGPRRAASCRPHPPILLPTRRGVRSAIHLVLIRLAGASGTRLSDTQRYRVYPPSKPDYTPVPVPVPIPSASAPAAHRRVVI
jgi:hypothetical protein